MYSDGSSSLVECNLFAKERENVFGRRYVVESFSCFIKSVSVK